MGAIFSRHPTLADWERTERNDVYTNPKTHWSKSRVHHHHHDTWKHIADKEVPANAYAHVGG